MVWTAVRLSLKYMFYNYLICFSTKIFETLAFKPVEMLVYCHFVAEQLATHDNRINNNKQVVRRTLLQSPSGVVYIAFPVSQQAIEWKHHCVSGRMVISGRRWDLRSLVEEPVFWFEGKFRSVIEHPSIKSLIWVLESDCLIGVLSKFCLALCCYRQACLSTWSPRHPIKNPSIWILNEICKPMKKVRG